MFKSANGALRPMRGTLPLQLLGIKKIVIYTSTYIYDTPFYVNIYQLVNPICEYNHASIYIDTKKLLQYNIFKSPYAEAIPSTA